MSTLQKLYFKPHRVEDMHPLLGEYLRCSLKMHMSEDRVKYIEEMKDALLCALAHFLHEVYDSKQVEEIAESFCDTLLKHYYELTTYK